MDSVRKCIKAGDTSTTQSMNSKSMLIIMDVLRVFFLVTGSVKPRYYPLLLWQTTSSMLLTLSLRQMWLKTYLAPRLMY